MCCVTFLHPQLEPTTGIIDKIYHRKDKYRSIFTYKSDCLYFQDLGTEILVKVGTLLDANQFKFMVPDSCLYYLPDITLILYQ